MQMRVLFAFLLLSIPFWIFSQGEKILAVHLEKYGQSTWEQIQTLQVDGKHVTKDYQTVPLKLRIRNNDQVRLETNGINGYILALNHQVFWSSGMDQFLPIEKQILNHALTIGSPLAKFQKEIRYGGLEVYQGSTFHSFKKIDDKLEVNYLIDRENDELRHIQIILNEIEPIKAIVTFDKYKSHHGLLTPTAVVIEIEDQFREWVYDDILLGTAIDEKIFEQPNSQ